MLEMFAVEAEERLAALNEQILRLEEDHGVFAGEAVTRRLLRLAEALGLEAKTEMELPHAAE